MYFGTIVFANEAIATASGYFFNSWLLYCVLKNWRPGLRQLSVVLIQNIILDMTYGLFPLFTGMWISVIDGRVFIVCSGLVRYTTPTIAGYAYCLYCFILSTCVFVFPLQCYFRYRILRQQNTISLFYNTILIIPPISVAFIIFIGFVNAYTFETNLPLFDAYAAQIIGQYVPLGPEVPFVVGAKNSTLLSIIFGVTCFAFLLSSTFVAYYARCISKVVKDNARMTQKYKHLYMMMHTTLNLQAIVFFIAVVLPCCIWCTFQVLQFENAHFLFSLGASLFAWAPVINPIMSIYLIRPYRKMVVPTIMKIFGHSKTSPTVSHGGHVHPYPYHHNHEHKI